MSFNIVSIQYYSLNIKYKLFRKISLRTWAAIFKRYNPFFEIVMFPCFRPTPYTSMCVLTIGSFSLFRKIVKTHGKAPVESWFFGISLIFDFSVYFNYA